MAFPEVSVVIPAYNSAGTISQTIESVLAQTVPVKEIVVVNDGSKDNLLEVLKPFAGRVIRVDQENRGLAGARNTGIEAAKSPWVAFVDADDLWRPNKLEMQFKLVQRHPDCLLYFTWFEYFGSRTGVPKSPDVPEAVYHDLETPFRTVILPSSVIIRRDIPCRFYDSREPCEDIPFYLKVLRKGSVAFLNQPLTLYRQHSQAITSQPDVVQRSWKSIFDLVGTLPESERSVVLPLLWRMLAETVTNAKYSRDWFRYWEMRKFAHKYWPKDLAMPALFHERIYPPFVYRIKDTIDQLTLKQGR